MVFKVRFSADGTLPRWWVLSAYKLAQMALLSSCKRTGSPTVRLLCSSEWVHLEVPRGGRRRQRTRETVRLASHGEFFIGAGNVALVTVALSEVGASVVLSNRAWPGQRGKESKTHQPRTLKGLGVQG